jgi:hypothetical protein
MRKSVHKRSGRRTNFERFKISTAVTEQLGGKETWRGQSGDKIGCKRKRAELNEGLYEPRRKFTSVSEC